MKPRIFPAVADRVETGPIQFGDDWPGTFLRGDTAGAHAMYLEIVLDASKADPLSVCVLRGLLSDLRSSDVRNHSKPGAEQK
jgi:hypothetical protein